MSGTHPLDTALIKLSQAGEIQYSDHTTEWYWPTVKKVDATEIHLNYNPSLVIESLFPNTCKKLFEKKQDRYISISLSDKYQDENGYSEMKYFTYLQADEFPSLVKKVIFNGPATIIIWKDDSKTIVKCKKGDKYDPRTGLAMNIVKKLFMDSSTRMNKWMDSVLEENGILEFDNPLSHFERPIDAEETKEKLKEDLNKKYGILAAKFDKGGKELNKDGSNQ